VAKKMGDIKAAAEIAGYDGYIFGSPTYSLDVPKPVKTFLLMAEKAGLEGKMGGAFGSYTHDVSYAHDTHAPAIIFDTLQRVCKLKPFELGPFTLNQSSQAAQAWSEYKHSALCRQKEPPKLLTIPLTCDRIQV